MACGVFYKHVSVFTQIFQGRAIAITPTLISSAFISPLPSKYCFHISALKAPNTYLLIRSRHRMETPPRHAVLPGPGRLVARRFRGGILHNTTSKVLRSSGSSSFTTGLVQKRHTGRINLFLPATASWIFKNLPSGKRELKKTTHASAGAAFMSKWGHLPAAG